jgi:hypothetical protein
LRGRGDIDVLAVFSNSQVKTRLRRHRNYKTDIQGAACSGKIVSQSAHRAERARRRHGDHGAPPGQSCPIVGDCAEATVEFRLFVDSSLSLCDAPIGCLNVKRTFKNVALPEFLLGNLQLRRRYRNSLARSTDVCLLLFMITFRCPGRSDKRLCVFSAADSLLSIERRFVRRCLSQFELLADDRIGNA